MFCVNGILFNHESPMRGGNLRYKKNYKSWEGRIKLGIQSKINSGDLEASRGLGCSGDYARYVRMPLTQ